MRSCGHRFLAVLAFFSIFSGIAYSQFYDTGQDPSSLRWMQIKTDHFRIIFPETYGKNGEDFAKSLNEACSSLNKLFPGKSYRIPVVIHNYTTNSNGYVAWAPKRMEIFPTPEQNTIPLDPFKQLSFHETAHVYQMVSLNSGFSRFLSYLAGEQLLGAEAIFLPLWFMEGDAVFAETALTGSGRGRSPSFQKEFKAITVERSRPYSYDQAVCGSFRNYIPDHYQSGYQMVTWVMSKNGFQVWNKTLDYTARNPFTLNPFNISLRQNTGLRKKDLYRETFDSLGLIWKNNISASGAKKYPEINPSRSKDYISYYSPVMAGHDSIIAIKTSLAGSPAFVLLNRQTGKEKKIHVPGQIYPWYISCGNRIIVWVETRNDPRWANRQYSIIKSLDLRNGIIRTISHKTRYLSAAISPDGRTIAATENTIENKNNLVLINIRSGEISASLPSPDNVYLQHPQWSFDGSKLTMITLNGRGEGIISFSISDNHWESIIPESNTDLQSSVLRNDSLFFVSSVSGTENIYVRTPEGKISSLTNSRFGADDICLNAGEIIFSDYTAEGNSLSLTGITSTGGNADPASGASFFLINRFKDKPLTGSSDSAGSYRVVPYRKFLNLFTLHSWMPFYADLDVVRSDPSSVRPGITLLSQNQLSTLISSAGYEYSQDGRNLLHAKLKWQGWYPVLESEIDYGYKPTISKFGENISGPETTRPGILFTNTVSVPLSFSTGKYYQYLYPGLTSDYYNDYIYLKENGSYDNGQNLISARLYFSNYHRYATRDIYPRWAQTFDIIYTCAPWDKYIYGTSISLTGALYLPGLLPNNGLRLRFEYEKQDPEKFLLGSRISLPRGYKNIISREIKVFSADYVMPIIYPDLNLSSIIYLKRLRTALFCDYSEGRGNTYYSNSSSGLTARYYHNYTETFNSAGFELIADFHLFRIPYMISGGVQSAWTSEDKDPVLKMLLNIELFGMEIGKRQMRGRGL
jgi:hypothetical protein